MNSVRSIRKGLTTTGRSGSGASRCVGAAASAVSPRTSKLPGTQGRDGSSGPAQGAASACGHVPARDGEPSSATTPSDGATTGSSRETHVVAAARSATRPKQRGERHAEPRHPVIGGANVDEAIDGDLRAREPGAGQAKA